MEAENLIVNFRVDLQPFIEGAERVGESIGLLCFALERFHAVTGGWPDPFFILSRHARTTRWKKDDEDN